MDSSFWMGSKVDEGSSFVSDTSSAITEDIWLNWFLIQGGVWGGYGRSGEGEDSFGSPGNVTWISQSSRRGAATAATETSCYCPLERYWRYWPLLEDSPRTLCVCYWRDTRRRLPLRPTAHCISWWTSTIRFLTTWEDLASEAMTSLTRGQKIQVEET